MEIRRASRELRWAVLAGIWIAGSPAISLAQADTNENGDAFASSFAVGDFDGDGREDLAVGVPGEDAGAGAVVVFRGAAPGLQLAQLLRRTDPRPRPDERFGTALAAGDFDGDGRDDLAVGAPAALTRTALPASTAPPPPAAAAPMGASPPVAGGSSTRGDGAIAAAGGSARAGAVFLFLGTDRGLVAGPSLDPSSAGMSSSPGGDDFGAALAAADFDGDRIDDLAVGAPREAAASGARAGSILMFRGSRDGLVPRQSLRGELDGLAAAESDEFGAALAAGDFDGDTIADLAVGAPGKAPAGAPRGGMIFVFRGSSAGLTAAIALDQAFEQLGTNEAGDEFGRSVAAGDFNGDGKDDLAIGAPGEAPGQDPRAGIVFILQSSDSGFRASAGIEQETPSGRFRLPLGVNALGDDFGRSLASGDFDGDGVDDLAVGAPGDSIGLAGVRAGSVFVFEGSPSGLSAAERVDQQTGALGLSSAGDRFGASLAAGDFDGDRRVDLAIGVAGKSAAGIAQFGALFAFRGTPDGLRAQFSVDQEGTALGGGGIRVRRGRP